MKNKYSSEKDSQNAEHSRAKHKSTTESVAPVKCVFCGEKKSSESQCVGCPFFNQAMGRISFSKGKYRKSF